MIFEIIEVRWFFYCLHPINNYKCPFGSLSLRPSVCLFAHLSVSLVLSVAVVFCCFFSINLLIMGYAVYGIEFMKYSFWSDCPCPLWLSFDLPYMKKKSSRTTLRISCRCQCFLVAELQFVLHFLFSLWIAMHGFGCMISAACNTEKSMASFAFASNHNQINYY